MKSKLLLALFALSTLTASSNRASDNAVTISATQAKEPQKKGTARLVRFVIKLLKSKEDAAFKRRVKLHAHSETGQRYFRQRRL